MEYERGIIVLANPYSEDASRKYNSVEVVFPQTGTVKYLCKLPHSLFMPGKITISAIFFWFVKSSRYRYQLFWWVYLFVVVVS